MSELAKLLDQKNIGKLDYDRVQKDTHDYAQRVHDAVTLWLGQLSSHNLVTIAGSLRKDLEDFDDCEVQLLLQLFAHSEPEISEPFTFFMRALRGCNNELQQQRKKWQLDPCPSLET